MKLTSVTFSVEYSDETAESGINLSGKEEHKTWLIFDW